MQGSGCWGQRPGVRTPGFMMPPLARLEGKQAGPRIALLGPTSWGSHPRLYDAAACAAGLKEKAYRPICRIALTHFRNRNSVTGTRPKLRHLVPRSASSPGGPIIANILNLPGNGRPMRYSSPPSSGDVKPHALGQRQLLAVVDRARLPAHVGFPGVGAGLAAAAGRLLAAEGAADLGARGADIDVGDPAVRALRARGTARPPAGRS